MLSGPTVRVVPDEAPLVLPLPERGSSPRLPPPPAVLLAPLPSPRPRGRVLFLVAVATAVVGLVSFGASQVFQRQEVAWSDHPQDWDERLVNLVAFVEADRGQSFRFPVYLDILTPHEMTRAAGIDGPDVDAAGQGAVTRAAELRALGLFGGDLSWTSSDRDVPFSVYNPATKRLAALSPQAEGDPDPSWRASLVRTLTYALRDQYTGLVEGETRASAPSVFQALAQGEALRTERRYRIEESAGAPAAAPRLGDAADQGLAAALMVELTVALLAEPMVDTIIDLDGPQAVDRAFSYPPLSEEALFDPSQYRGRGSVLTVAVPPPEADAVILRQGPLGPVTWYLMLAQVTDAGTALRAAYGWGGDHVMVMSIRGTTCVRLVFRGDSGIDLVEMRSALALWVAAAVPGSRREMTLVGDQLVLLGCDPGIDAPSALPREVMGPVVAPRLAMQTIRALHRDRGLSYARARCAAVDFVGQYSAEELDDLAQVAATQGVAVLPPPAAQDHRLAVAISHCP